MSCKTECITCGCSAEKDKYGDRICYCATCKYRGGCIIVQWNKPKPIITECITCGCSAEKDEYGDRICYCATCKERGGCIIVQWNKSKPIITECINCGCSAEKDEYGDRICYCATCKELGGCISDVKNDENENDVHYYDHDDDSNKIKKYKKLFTYRIDDPNSTFDYYEYVTDNSDNEEN